TRAAVITEQPQRDDEIQRQPRGGEFLDDLILLFFEEAENQNRAHRRQPGDDREKVVCEHVSPRTSFRSPTVREGYLSWKLPLLTRGLLTLKDLDKINRHGDEQSYDHHQRVIRRQPCLRRAHDWRHQANYKIGNRVDQAIDEVFVRGAGDLTGQARQPCCSIYGAVDDIR